MVVNSLLDRYPLVSAQLFTGTSKKVGVNPKVNNMIQGYEAAKYENILISDSGLKIKEDTLTVMMGCLTETTGLVHQMPFICDREGFSGVLEKVYFGTQHAKMYLNADLLGINCVTGMSCLFRKHVIEDAGGFTYLGKFLAEDYYLGKIFIERGWRIRVCSQPAMQNAGHSSVVNFQARMMRWAKLRASLVPLTIILEPISESVILGAIVSWAVSVMFTWSPLAFFFVHILVWFLLDYLLLLVVQGGPLPFSKFEYVLGWVFREATSFYIMLRAHAQRHLTWRNRKYILHWEGIGEDFKTRTYV
jgi:ceramide glucosyltransferase